jgi:hypothetical protein
MRMTTSMRLMALKVRDGTAPPGRGYPHWPNPDNWRVSYLIGEWIPAWGWMSLAFLVAFLGVVGLGWFVLSKEAINRRFDEAPNEDSGGPH